MLIDIDAHMRLRELVREMGSQKAVAMRLGISAPMVSDLLKKRREFSPRLLDKLNLRRAVVEK